MFNNTYSECDSFLGYKIFIIQNRKVTEFDLDYPAMESICPLTYEYKELYELIKQTYIMYSK
jgi:hypothetical protein